MVAVKTSDSVAAKVRKKILRSTDRFWHVDDFDGSTQAVAKALERLVEDEQLTRVRRGSYWRGRRTRFGVTPPPPIAAVREVIGANEAIGAAGWYASNLLRLTTQVPALPQVAVSRRVPTGIDGVQIVNRAGRTGRRDAHLDPAEVTLLEALEGLDRYADVDALTALERLLDYLANEDIHPRKLARASATESVAVRERLKLLLWRAGHEVEAERIDGARSKPARDRALAFVADWLPG